MYFSLWHPIVPINVKEWNSPPMGVMLGISLFKELNFNLSKVNYEYVTLQVICQPQKSEKLIAFTLERVKFNSKKDWFRESLPWRVKFTLLHWRWRFWRKFEKKPLSEIEFFNDIWLTCIMEDYEYIYITEINIENVHFFGI